MSSEPPLIQLLVEDDQGRKEFVLDGPTYSIGRDPKCNICLVSHFVSRHHATLVRVPAENGTGGYRIVDGNLEGKLSSNGLLINGRKLRRHDLQNGDAVILGPQVWLIYSLRQRNVTSPDEFDITLVPPDGWDDELLNASVPCRPFPTSSPSSAEAEINDDRVIP